MGNICTKESTRSINTDYIPLMSVFSGVTEGKLLGIVDGDTVRIGFEYGDHNVTTLLRIIGIDSVEKKHPKYHEARISVYKYFGLKHNEFTKHSCVKQRSEFIEKDINVLLEISSTPDKYGRLLGDIIFNGIKLSKHQLCLMHVMEYDGKTKQNQPF